MQALRHASRRALHASVFMQETCATSLKAYSSEAVAARKTKEERFELAKQFVAKFKAANNGQLPGITLLRKEVGGKYETLKEVLQEFAKGQDEPDTLKQTVELKDAEGKREESAAVAKDRIKKKSPSKELVKGQDEPDIPKQHAERKDAEGKTQEFAAADKDGIKQKSPSSEDSKKNKKEMRQVLKGSKSVKSVDQAPPRTSSKDMGQTLQSVPVKDAFKLGDTALDTALITDEDDDDDSDIAAAEYLNPPWIQRLRKDVEAAKGKEKVLGNGVVAYLKNNAAKQNDGQALQSKHSDIKQPEVQDAGRRVELPLDDTAAKHPSTDGIFGSGSKAYGPVTTVVRIINLPVHMTASKLKAICENVARVHEVDFRRGRIADVQFDVDIQEMNDVLNRLRKVGYGIGKSRFFSAHRFSCGNNANSQFKPQDINHYRQVRNILFSSLEQRFRFLCYQVQDYRELQELKLAR